MITQSCDVCRKQVNKDGKGGEVYGVVTLAVPTPPVDDLRDERYDLCEACTRRTHHFLQEAQRAAATGSR